MNDPTNADWNRLVRKTYRRPLIFDPNAVQTAEGTKVRPKLGRLAGIIGVGGFFAGLLFFITGSIQGGDPRARRVGSLGGDSPTVLSPQRFHTGGRG